MKTRPSRLRFHRLLVLLFSAGFCAWPLRGDEMIRQVQEELRKRHLYFGDIDGCATPATAAALKTYQQRKGFPATGAPDETTLRSLTLLPPASDAHPVSPLPDITVLRSDEARASEQKAAATPPEPAPAAVTTPPEASPAATAMDGTPSAEEVRAFIDRYLLAGQKNDAWAELLFYGDRVDYFGDGLVDRKYIQKDVHRYDARWPERHFSLVGPAEVAPVPGSDPPRIRVHCRYRFAVKGPRYSAAGEVDTEYLLSGSRPEELRIVSMKEERVRP